MKSPEFRFPVALIISARLDFNIPSPSTWLVGKLNILLWWNRCCGMSLWLTTSSRAIEAWEIKYFTYLGKRPPSDNELGDPKVWCWCVFRLEELSGMARRRASSFLLPVSRFAEMTSGAWGGIWGEWRGWGCVDMGMRGGDIWSIFFYDAGLEVRWRHNLRYQTSCGHCLDIKNVKIFNELTIIVRPLKRGQIGILGICPVSCQNETSPVWRSRR